MAKYCSDCTYLNPKDTKGGNKGFCKCSKKKTHVLANMPRCEHFQEAYSRRWYDKEELYDAAKDFSPPYDGNISGVISAAVLLGVLLIVLKLLGY